ncbi:unnamed protein product, partial [Polarella glacialis]
GSVSLIHNNLAGSSSGWIASIHNSLNPGGGKLLLHSLTTGECKDGPEVVQATSVRFVETSHGPVLCLTSTNGTQIYTEDATTLIFYLPIADAGGDSQQLKFHQAACFVQTLQHIVVGTSKGSVYPISAAGAGQYMAISESEPSSFTTEVADLCYCAMADAVVSVHSNGDLRVWTPAVSGPYTNSLVVPGACQAPVRIMSLGPRLIVADGPGSLLIYDAFTCELQVDVSAHGRSISAAVVREDLDQIVTVGEDT